MTAKAKEAAQGWFYSVLIFLTAVVLSAALAHRAEGGTCVREHSTLTPAAAHAAP